ncbi:MAG: Stk1 family PASTA domain-containing Ser/Thr kinase [Chloroflexi bacterium]|nr:Stk1 family PASTA domain-containing Ser/Thr kinase [Chloroflexota bacterium]
MEQLANRYRLIELVGKGGMAKVYKAEDQLLGRFVAVKILRDRYASDKAFLGRFLQEARSAASLSHSNIVNVFDVGDENGRYYIVMEYVEGANLKEVIQKEGPLPASRVVNVAGQICAGLQAAHSRNIIHRDVKPQNVLVTAEGQVKIADFGIARALGETSFSQTDQVLGSIHYLSPEQAQGKPASPASDIYALGVSCYEMLTGRLPFEGETEVGIAHLHIQEPPRPPRQLNPAIPPTLESIVLKALAKDPAERYPSAKEMGQAFQDYAELGQQATGIIGAVKAEAPPAIASATTVTPVATAAPDEITGRKRGGTFLLLVLALLALLSVLGLCALGAAIAQTYGDKFAFGLSSPNITLPLPSATSSRLLVKVPGVEGKDAAEAQRAIESAGLAYREGPPEFSNSIQAGLVIRQSIQPETSVVPGLEVVVVLSKRPSAVEVISVVGLKFAEAQSKLVSQGFSVVRQDQVTGTSAPETVFDQNPKGGAKLSPGATITLIVSKASPRIVVPNVVGKSEAEAKKAIVDAGLRNFPWTNYQGHADLPDRLLQMVDVGEVISTDPPAGREVDAGVEVKIAVRKD